MHPHPAVDASEQALPRGTITFLLTDIEGSTALWEQHPRVMHAALARHDALVADCMWQQGGFLIKSRGEGDSTFNVFASAGAAIAAAIALQQMLLVERWPDNVVLRVRMALHTGEADQRGDDYYGPTVNRAARIRALAHGGQILLSQVTAELVRESILAGVSLGALGAHALAGMRHPEQVYQLLHPALPADFPPLRSHRITSTNLPEPVTSFIGRERERQQLRVLLRSTRLLSVVGSGGSGKTRLVLELATEVVAEYPQGVWIAELATLLDPGLVPAAIAAVLDVHEEANSSLMDTLVAYLRTRHLLLLLDNCEHVLPACALIVRAVLRSCPGVRILITSQEALAVEGETTWQMPTLSLPTTAEGSSLLDLSQSEAVRLFLARATAVRASFALTAQNAATIVRICRLLDGLPLAIELAAARLAVLPLEELAQRLDDRFRLLRGGNRSGAPRQQTLLATMEWSYNLLAPAEQLLLQRLSVFAGGWRLAAAERICSGSSLAKEDVLDVLLTLVSRSLVQLEEYDGLARYRLLETVRQYARDRLEQSGESAAMRRRHLDWYLALAIEANQERIQTAERGMWLDRLEAEHDNLRAALSWCMMEAPEEGAALRLTAALWWFWAIRGHLSEGRQWLAEALALPTAEVVGFQMNSSETVAGDLAAVRAAVLVGASTLAQSQGDYTQAAALGQESLALWRELDDEGGTARALACLGEIERQRGDYARAVALYEEGLRLRQAIGDRRGTAQILNGLGTVALYQADYGRATEFYAESATLLRALKDRRGVATAANNLGIVAQRQGDLDRAAGLYDEARGLWRELGDRRGVILVLINMGMLAQQQGDLDRAAGSYRESLALAFGLGDKWTISLSLEGLAEVAIASRRWLLATRLLGAATALRDAIGVPIPVADREEHDRALTVVRRELSPSRFTQAWVEGTEVTLDMVMIWLAELAASADHL